jgi:hypothetical protein
VNELKSDIAIKHHLRHRQRMSEEGGWRAEPTPEQLRDDGRADGIPVRTLADMEAEDRQRREALVREFAGHRVRHKSGGRQSSIVLIREDGKRFEGVAAVDAEYGAGSYRRAYNAAYQGSRFGGSRWQRGERDAPRCPLVARNGRASQSERA